MGSAEGTRKTQDFGAFFNETTSERCSDAFADQNIGGVLAEDRYKQDLAIDQLARCARLMRSPPRVAPPT